MNPRLHVCVQLIEPGEPLRAGKIRDSNRTALIAQLKEAGVAAVDLGVAPDKWVLSNCGGPL